MTQPERPRYPIIYKAQPLEKPARATDDWDVLADEIKGHWEYWWDNYLRETYLDPMRVWYPRQFATIERWVVKAARRPADWKWVEQQGLLDLVTAGRHAERIIRDYVLGKVGRGLHRRVHPDGTGGFYTRVHSTDSSVGAPALRILREAGALDDLDPGPPTEERQKSALERWRNERAGK